MTTTVFRNGLIFDGTGSAPRRADVAVTDGRFSAVGDALEGDSYIDVAGRTLLPGLFDCHVHVLGVHPRIIDKLNQPFSYQFYNATKNLRKLLSIGITTVRDCAGADLGVKRAVEDGLVPGPRLQISITALSQTGGHMDGWTPSAGWVDPFYAPHPGRPSSIADGVTEIRKVARQSLRAGADFLKVLGTHIPAGSQSTRFTVEELEAVAAEAEAAGVPVVVHAYGTDAARDAIIAGARSIEHVSDLDDETIAALVERGTWLVPTVGMRLSSMPDSPIEPPEKVAWDSPGHQSSNEKYDPEAEARRAFTSLKRAYDAGVKIAMGSDYGNTSGDNLDELIAMNYAGMMPADVLVAATSSAAALLRLDDELGTIEVGKRADVVVVDGDVYDFIGLRRNIESVYKDGLLVHAR